MAKKTKSTIVSDNPLDQLSDLVETKIETKKEKKNEEIKAPLTKSQEIIVSDLIKKYEEKEKIVSEYEAKLEEVKDKIGNPFHIEESFKEKKNIGSFFLDVDADKRAQFIPMDSWSDISVSKNDDIKLKLERINKILGEENYKNFITKSTDIKLKSSIIEDKEKLIKFVQLVKANPEFKSYFEITEKYKIEKGALDISFKLTKKQREELLTEVTLKSASVKVVKNPDFKD